MFPSGTRSTSSWNPLEKGAARLSKGTSISLLLVVGSVFRSALVDIGKELASGLSSKRGMNGFVSVLGRLRQDGTPEN